MKIISLCFISMALFGSVAGAGVRTIENISTSTSINLTLRLLADSESSALIETFLTSPQIEEQKNPWIPATTKAVRSKDNRLSAFSENLGKGGELMINLPTTSEAVVHNAVEKNGNQFVSMSDRTGSGMDQLLSLLMTLSGPRVQKYFSNGSGNPKVPNAVRIRLDNSVLENPIDCYPNFERTWVTCRFHLVRESGL